MIRAGVLVAAAALLVAAAGCGGAVRNPTKAARSSLPWYFHAPEVEFGYIRSLTPFGHGYKLRLDLHLLFGPDKTGLAACIDNHECPRGQNTFLDDTYDHDLRYVVTYYVPPGTPVTLVGDASHFPQVTARYFYELAHGENPRHVEVTTLGKDALTEFAFYVEVGAAYPGFEPVQRLGQVFHP